MATLKDAEFVRTVKAEFLRRRGAHAIAVDRSSANDDDYTVVAYFKDEPTESLPATLEAERERHTVRVPLIVRRAEAFRPE